MHANSAPSDPNGSDGLRVRSLTAADAVHDTAPRRDNSAMNCSAMNCSRRDNSAMNCYRRDNSSADRSADTTGAMDAGGAVNDGVGLSSGEGE